MAVNLSIKNVPDRLADALRTRADRNHRSLQGELMAILESAVAGREAGGAGATAEPAPGPLKLSIDEVAERAARLFPKGTSSSASFIRAMRDGRYGEDWARTGRHAEPE